MVGASKTEGLVGVAMHVLFASAFGRGSVFRDLAEGL